MTTILDILELLESTAGRLAREEILNDNSRNELLKRVFWSVLDPYIDFGVRKFKAVAAKGLKTQSDEETIDQFLDLLLNELAPRNLSGNAAKDAVTRHMSLMDERQQKWCHRILLRNLRVGVDHTCNKVWPGLIKKFEVQLAKTLKTGHEKDTGIQIIDEVSYPVRVEPKLDGLRCVAVKANGIVTMYTRNGNVLETLPQIAKTLTDAVIDNCVFDGEALGNDWNESNSVLMSSKGSKDDSNITYWVFDSLTLKEWVDQATDVPMSERVNMTKSRVASARKSSHVNVKCVEGETVTNEADLMRFYQNAMNGGHEGIMLKDLTAPYRFKRSDAILKMKPVITFEGVIIGSYEGRVGTKNAGKFGGFYVCLPNKIVTRIGGGFNDAIRAEFQLNGVDTYNGRIVEIEGQPDPLTKDGLTKDGRVRFPVFTRFRDPSDVAQDVLDTVAAWKANTLGASIAGDE